jgi:putative transposase
MRRGRFSEEQVIGVLKQHEAGRKVPELAREIGVSEATIYIWKSKYGGTEVSDAQKLKALENENRRLKHLVADLSLDKEVLKAVISKNVWSAAGLQSESSMTKVCVNVSGLFCGQKALATMSMRAHPAS